jgi:6-phosphogluconolactonase
MSSPTLHTFDSRSHLDAALADLVVRELTESLAADGNALLCLSGGSTPAGFFAELSQRDLDWAAVTLVPVDERYVPVDHQDSNTKLIADRLKQGRAADAGLIEIHDPALDADAAAARLENELDVLPWPPAVSILGMGEDGHTASFFPDSPQLETCFAPAGGKRAVAIDTPSSPWRRVTLTAPALLESRHLILHLTGERKREVYQEAFASNLPIARLLAQRPDAIVWWAP